MSVTQTITVYRQKKINILKIFEENNCKMTDALVSYMPVLAFIIPLTHTQMLKEPICLSLFIQLNTQQDHFLVMFLVLGLISLHSVRYSS